MKQHTTALFITVVILLCIGVVMIYSTSAIYAQEQHGDSYYYLTRQAIWITLGLIAFAVAVNIDYHELRRYCMWLILLGIFLLGLVFVPGLGRSAGGACRWLRIGPMNFQPSELVKFAVIVYCADLLSKKQRQMDRFWKTLLLPLSIVPVAMGMILLQPDMGTTILIGLIVVLMLFAGRVRFRDLAFMALASLPALYCLVFSSGYRRRRIIAFLNPWADPEGSGFQIIQSFIALGSGGLGGMGLAQSRQKFYYLPAAHTDFILSIIGEEFGFIGAATILTLFLLLLIVGMKICFSAPDHYGSLLALGIVSILSLQALINFGVVTGSLPTKGQPLPFISFGGSSMLFNLFAVGVLVNIGKHTGEAGTRHCYGTERSLRTVWI